MRRPAAVRARARIRAGTPLVRRTRGVLLVAAAVLGWWLVALRVPSADGAALGLLAAGGWGLGLIPVHADRRNTGPARRTGGEPPPVQPTPVEQPPPIR